MFWGGWGGSLALIDLENQTSIAYVMNKMADSLVGDTRGALTRRRYLRITPDRVTPPLRLMRASWAALKQTIRGPSGLAPIHRTGAWPAGTPCTEQAPHNPRREPRRRSGRRVGGTGSCRLPRPSRAARLMHSAERRHRQLFNLGSVPARLYSRAPRPRVTKLNDQRMSTSSRFWKPIRYQRCTTSQVTQAKKPLSRIPFEVGDGGGSADRGEVALVAVAERAGSRPRRRSRITPAA